MAGLYLHIPFCEKKCIYCDFYSIENLKPINHFVDMIEQEITMYKSLGEGETYQTIFFGGGTPSLLSSLQMERILNKLHKNYSVDSNAEVTIEANPGTVDGQKIKDYQKMGINRISFGVQSFHQDELSFLGRIHDADQARRSVKLAQDAGLNNINIDLIFSLPNQTREKWEFSMNEAVLLGTQHISAYSLIVEPHTPLQRLVESKQISTLPTEAEAELYEVTMSFLANHGFEQYEISNYAKKGHRSQHNYHYWTHAPYIGFGPSAHSFWAGKRWWNVKNLQSYFERLENQKTPVEAEELLSNEQLFDEYIMLGLRSDGVRLDEIYNLFGIDLRKSHKYALNEYANEGLGELSNDVFRLTNKGYLICDSIAEQLISFPVAA